ncbi:hypothetical protein BVG16_02595 [Paenibacillus selenitireducens]|uniref:CobW C-terminal domain-containing protein n=1 Tax=Paenibacillus selenitireducens TaxID=1324314 RepID=A0A1T2XMY0_9BACL|nr:CobW family GTP-binding protein [Paenibacillus selenitireducens]OPA81229.1 hypothetical protein BVG16_02595 [Paenibacillus selenitireducens]
MKIPVMILSGFLGSGKTTLLLRLLQETKRLGMQPGVLINELGRQDVDGHILEGFHPGSIQKLLDGCVCCSKKNELAGSLQTLLQQKPSIVFIELTGVANPEEITDALTEPGLVRSFELQQIITVIDAEHALDYNSIFATDRQLVYTLRRQMEVADLIVLNKTDLAPQHQILKVENMIRKHNEKARILPTAHSRMDVNPFLQEIYEQRKSSNTMATPGIRTIHIGKQAVMERSEAKRVPSTAQPSHTRLSTLCLACPPHPSLTKEAVERFLGQWNKSLLRAKGYITIPSHQQTYLMQLAGKRVYWEPSSSVKDPYLVFIGIDLPTEDIQQAWNKLYPSSLV